jgi:Raf kinase inhibitor-like YbhB/YbcL family protein
MRTLTISIAAFLLISMSAFTGNKNLSVTSTAFTNNGMIPPKYSCNGEKISPPLTVRNIPSGTKSLAVIVQDPDVPKGGFTHWVVWDIDTEGNIPEGFASDHVGLNSLNQVGYSPVCAMSGTHHYHFMVYALDCELDMRGSSSNRFDTDGPSTNKAKLERVIKGHILAKGELVGLFNKDVQ